MMHNLDSILGLPLARVTQILQEDAYVVTCCVPPRKQDKAGTARVTRAVMEMGVVKLTISPFEDTVRICALETEDA